MVCIFVGNIVVSGELERDSRDDHIQALTPHCAALKKKIALQEGKD